MAEPASAAGLELVLRPEALVAIVGGLGDVACVVADGAEGVLVEDALLLDLGFSGGTTGETGGGFASGVGVGVVCLSAGRGCCCCGLVVGAGAVVRVTESGVDWLHEGVAETLALRKALVGVCHLALGIGGVARVEGNGAGADWVMEGCAEVV